MTWAPLPMTAATAYHPTACLDSDFTDRRNRGSATSAPMTASDVMYAMRLPSNGKGARSRADLMKMGASPQLAAAPSASRMPREVWDCGSGSCGLLVSPRASTIGPEITRMPPTATRRPIRSLRIDAASTSEKSG